MRAPLRRLLALGGFAALVGLPILRLGTLDLPSRISTDVLDLIPGDGGDEDFALVRSLVQQKQGRVALFAITLPAAPGEDEEGRANTLDALGRAFGEELRASPAFAEVGVLSDPAARERVARFVFEHRLELLLPNWLEERSADLPGPDGGDETGGSRLAARAVAELDAFLREPTAPGMDALLPADPLLLIPRLIERLPGATAVAGATTATDAALVWSLLAGSPLDEAVQVALAGAVEHATRALRAAHPDARVQWTSIARFAQASRERIRTELTALNIASLAAVFLVTVAMLRRVHHVLHLLPVVACAFLGAWAVTFTVFGHVHVMVLIVGSLLAGIATDYGFHLFVHRPAGAAAHPGRIRSVLRPLLASALTTIVGFSVLGFSELPVIRAIGVFVVAGLLFALLGALLWSLQGGELALPVRRAAGWSLAAAVPGKHRNAGRTGARIALGALALVALAGPLRLRWHDDIRELEVSSPELLGIDREVRGLFGESPGRATYLSRGATAAEARAAAGRFHAWLEEAHPAARASSLAFAVPREAAWRAFPRRLEALRNFGAALRRALEDGGFDASAFDPFFDAWRELGGRRDFPDYDRVARSLEGALGGPAGLLMDVSDRPAWFVTLVDANLHQDPPAETATVNLSQLATLNRVFSRYRQETLRVCAWGALVAAAIVIALAGPRRGLRILAVPVASCLFTLGLFGLAGVTLNLFHLLAAMLAVCLTFDYAIFAADHARRGEPPPPSIRLSGLTTAASFAALAFSGIPVVAALGATVALTVAAALAVLELAPLALTRPGGPP